MQALPTPAQYALACLVLGVIIIGLGAMAITTTDKRLRPAMLWCHNPECLRSWVGRDKLCSHCGARGRTEPGEAHDAHEGGPLWRSPQARAALATDATGPITTVR